MSYDKIDQAREFLATNYSKLLFLCERIAALKFPENFEFGDEVELNQGRAWLVSYTNAHSLFMRYVSGMKTVVGILRGDEWCTSTGLKNVLRHLDFFCLNFSEKFMSDNTRQALMWELLESPQEIKAVCVVVDDLKAMVRVMKPMFPSYEFI